MNERKLVSLAQQGNEDAWKEIVDQHGPMIFKQCFSYVRDFDKASDLKQEALLQIARTLKTFKCKSRLSTWMFRITRNIFLMKVRKRQLKTESLSEPISDDSKLTYMGTLSDQHISENTMELRLTLKKLFPYLAPGHRSILLLHLVEGYTHKEISEVLGCNIGTSKSQLNKARVKFKELYNSRSLRRFKKKSEEA